MSSARRVAVLTPRGRSAVAVVRVRAEPEVFDQPAALFRPANGRPVGSQPIDRLCCGRWGSEPGEDVVVCRIAPDVTEVSCHGGVAATARIVRDLQQRGCRTADGADIISSDDYAVAAEDLHELTRASTLRTAGILLEQSTGLLSRAVAATLEAGSAEWTVRIDQLLRWAEFGRHLARPWQTALVGLPNVGKSSLMNALLGYGRSIVYAEPGTTRDVVTAVTAFDGWPVELCDTAGLRDAPGEIEAEGVVRARRQAEIADLRIIVLDSSRPVTDAERRLIAETPGALVVASKCDLPSGWTEDAMVAAMPVSSLTGAGVSRLAGRIASALVPEAPGSGTAIPVTERQVESLRCARAAAVRGEFDAARAYLERCQPGAAAVSR